MKTTVYTFAHKDRRGIAVEVFTSPEALKRRTDKPMPLGVSQYSVDSHEIDAPACCSRTVNRKLLEALKEMIREFKQPFNVRRDFSKMVAFEAARTAIAEAEANPVPKETVWHSDCCAARPLGELSNEIRTRAGLCSKCKDHTTFTITE